MERKKQKTEYLNIKDVDVIKIKNMNMIKERAFFIADNLNGKEIFIHGGCNSNEIIDIINLMNKNKVEWKNLQNFSREISYLYFDKKLYGHKSVSINIQGKDCILIYGGLEDKNFNKQVYIVQKEDFEWDSANFSICDEYPLPRCFHTMNYDPDNDLIYIFGGWNSNLINFKGENFSSLWEYKIINSLCKFFF